MSVTFSEFVRACWARACVDLAAPARWWAQQPRRRRRLLAMAGILLGWLAIPAMAMAADGTNPWLALTQAKDSEGFTAAQYELSLDSGGLTNPGNSASAWLAANSWAIYRMWVGASLWLLDIVLSFRIVTLLQAPFVALATAIRTVIDQIGLVPTVAVFAVVMSGFLLFRARHGAAIGEMLVTLVLTSLMATGLSNPTGWVAGDQGAIASAQDVGVAMSGEIFTAASRGTTTAATDLDGAKTEMVAHILDALVRRPHQLINYGQILPDGACTQAYNKSLTQPVDEARTTVADACGDGPKTAADSPGWALIGAFIVEPSGGMFFLILVILMVLSVAMTAFVLFEAAKFPVVLLKAILPGASRLGIFISAALIVVGLVFLAASVTGIALLILILESLFAATKDWPPVGIFLVVDIVLLASAIGAVVLFTRSRKSARTAGEKAGKALASRPTALPQGGGFTAVARSAAAPVLQMRATRQLRSSLTPGGGGEGVKSGGFVAGVARAGVMAGSLALKSTVGAPVYAPRVAAAAKTAMAARKASLLARLDQVDDRATAFGHEYVSNVARAGRFGGKVTGVTAAARGMRRGAGTASRAAAPGLAAALIAAGGPVGAGSSRSSSAAGGPSSHSLNHQPPSPPKSTPPDPRPPSVRRPAPAPVREGSEGPIVRHPIRRPATHESGATPPVVRRPPPARSSSAEQDLRTRLNQASRRPGRPS